MADAMARNWDFREVCRLYKCSVTTVRNACNEYGIQGPNQGDPHRHVRAGKTLAILADIIHSKTGDTLGKIARKHNVTTARISQVLRDAASYGIPTGRWRAKSMERGQLRKAHQVDDEKSAATT